MCTESGFHFWRRADGNKWRGLYELVAGESVVAATRDRPAVTDVTRRRLLGRSKGSFGEGGITMDVILMGR